MSELTFNIADYRPSVRVRTNAIYPAGNAHAGLAVVSPHAAPRKQYPQWLDSQPAVVDIRLVREAHGSYPRRGKILRFSNPAAHRLYMMPAHISDTPADDDPGPMVA